MPEALRPVYSRVEIRNAVCRIARAINRDCEGKEVLFLSVLKGSFVFLADLVREVRVPCAVEFVRLSSYGSDTRSSGAVRLEMPHREPLFGRHVIVVEDIVDSGLTLSRLLDHLRAEQPASVAVCALVDKTGRREASVRIDYSGFVLEEGFLVGYGLDFAERYRNLSAIYELLLPSEAEKGDD